MNSKALVTDEIRKLAFDAFIKAVEADKAQSTEVGIAAALETVASVIMAKMTVPDGWKLVPKKLTPYMGHSGVVALDDDGSMQAIWDSMLDVAPEPPK